MSTINYKEIEKFSKLSEEWWDPHGKFKPLHKFNPVRIKYIKQNIIEHFNIANLKNPLNNLSLLDVGCGGGLLSEPMCRLGAKVTGIDATRKNINVAKIHAKKNKLKINYLIVSPEKLKIKSKFDVILNMEVIEHVGDVNLFIKNCSKLIKKRGIMFVATINKNLKSYIFAILGAEYILRWLPIGTHDWDKFLTPQDLEIITKKNDFVLDELIGLKFNLFSKKWYRSKDKSVNYISTFFKN